MCDVLCARVKCWALRGDQDNAILLRTNYVDALNIMTRAALNFSTISKMLMETNQSSRELDSWRSRKSLGVKNPVKLLSIRIVICDLFSRIPTLPRHRSCLGTTDPCLTPVAKKEWNGKELANQVATVQWGISWEIDTFLLQAAREQLHPQ